MRSSECGIESEDVAGSFVRRVKALLGLGQALREPRLEEFDDRRLTIDDRDGKLTRARCVIERRAKS